VGLRPAATVSTSVHELLARECVEEPDRVLAAVAFEVAVVEIAHRQARPHVAGQLERGEAGSERPWPLLAAPAQRSVRDRAIDHNLGSKHHALADREYGFEMPAKSMILDVCASSALVSRQRCAQ